MKILKENNISKEFAIQRVSEIIKILMESEKESFIEKLMVENSERTISYKQSLEK